MRIGVKTPVETLRIAHKIAQNDQLNSDARITIACENSHAYNSSCPPVITNWWFGKLVA